ncbi:hypothetical protein WJX75_003044 [Coccomyxa subellipsoidea]|uniref:Transcription factor TFIIIC triple barrel domain-containing protein n=1 Tax=Coccomyxa subellipsoidea TaxID=248742 RepID=A0ABR2YV11_9CHLO
METGVDEDTAYVYVDFSGIKSNLLPTVGERVSIKGLDSAAPEVEVGDGTLLRGKYEDSIGSLMFFAREEKDPSSNPRPMDEGQSTGAEAAREVNEAGPSQTGGNYKVSAGGAVHLRMRAEYSTTNY